MTAIRFDHVDVIFGTHTKEALKLLDQGLGRAEILSAPARCSASRTPAWTSTAARSAC